MEKQNRHIRNLTNFQQMQPKFRDVTKTRHSSSVSVQNNNKQLGQTFLIDGNVEQSIKQRSRNAYKTIHDQINSKILEKPHAFYRFGLRQDEKKQCKRVFSQVFKMKNQKLKGTFSVNDLWDNKTMVYYLKQNSIFQRKQSLMKEFRHINGKITRKKRIIHQEKQKDFVNKFRKWIDDEKKIDKKQYLKTMSPKQACFEIQKQIVNIQQNKTKSQSHKIICSMQKNHEYIQKMAKRFQQSLQNFKC